MRESELPAHWRFAAGQALECLRRFVQSFDFLGQVNGHSYVGVEPSYLVEVIDGFLGEAEGVLYRGDRTNLQSLRAVLVDDIQPTYEQGLAAGREHWRRGKRSYGAIPTDELHRLALRVAPGDSDTIRAWFAEGFCLAYASEELESVRGEGTAQPANARHGGSSTPDPEESGSRFV